MSKKTYCFASLIFVYSTALGGVQPTAEQRQKAASVTANNLLTTQFAADPSNAEVVDAVRAAAEKGDSAARIALLKIGDSHTTKICFDELRIRDISNWMPASEAIKRSGNPRLILPLIEILNTEESTESERTYSGDEVSRIPPVSIRAAWAIRILIINSGVFTSEVSDWAEHLDIFSITKRSKMRDEMRLWCVQNKPSLEAQHYTDIKPPTQNRSR